MLRGTRSPQALFLCLIPTFHLIIIAIGSIVPLVARVPLTVLTSENSRSISIAIHTARRDFAFFLNARTLAFNTLFEVEVTKSFPRLVSLIACFELRLAND
jgi:hypothetical protein